MSHAYRKPGAGIPISAYQHVNSKVSLANSSCPAAESTRPGEFYILDSEFHAQLLGS